MVSYPSSPLSILCPPPFLRPYTHTHTHQLTKHAENLLVYYFRWIMHNYSTPYAISILKNLLPSLKPGARVIINDHCLREAGQETAWDDKIMRRMDMVMLTLLNAQERTEAEFRDLFRDVDEGFVFKVNPFFSLSFSGWPQPPPFLHFFFFFFFSLSVPARNGRHVFGYWC